MVEISGQELSVEKSACCIAISGEEDGRTSLEDLVKSEKAGGAIVMVVGDEVGGIESLRRALEGGKMKVGDEGESRVSSQDRNRLRRR